MRILMIAAAFTLMSASIASPSWAQGQVAGVAEVQAVTTVVSEFGRKLRSVAVLAPKPIAAAAMDGAYANLVAHELLAAWKSNPETAPGKRTSSPSPERIDITSVKPAGRDAYVVSGKVILLTAQERRSGGVFQANPVTLTVARQKGKWVITAYEEKQGS